jgi:photosystem II stability/assembly factor-like uncharacterized protein
MRAPVKRRAGITVLGRLPIVGVLACVGASAPTAGSTNTTPAALVVPSAIAFWDSGHGVLGTGTCPGATRGACRGGTIELTSNGGRSFRLVLRTRHPVTGLSTAGPRGAVAQTDGGGSFRTLDGGRSWRPFRLRYGASFATPRIGLGFRTYMTHDHLALELLATNDGGRTWRRRASPCTQAIASAALIDLVTPSLGWIVCLGQPGAGNQEKAVFRTTDRGQTWRAGAAVVVFPQRNVHGGIEGYGYPQGVAFAADGFGILWESRGTLYVTRDSGTNWLAKPKIARPEIDFGRGAAAFPDGRGVLLLGRGGGLPARLLTTDDAGRTWGLVRRWA